MKSHFLFLAGLMLMIGLSAGCSDSNTPSVAEAEEKVPVVSEKLTQDESTLIASAEAEEKSAGEVTLSETPSPN
ncbi:MAG: hypothetical protein HY282_08950 [Nitrospirae bacterium]|nr:hypothetical protein [Candidatus Manganitrophaceae bacterium]